MNTTDSTPTTMFIYVDAPDFGRNAIKILPITYVYPRTFNVPGQDGGLSVFGMTAREINALLAGKCVVRFNECHEGTTLMKQSIIL